MCYHNFVDESFVLNNNRDVLSINTIINRFKRVEVKNKNVSNVLKLKIDEYKNRTQKFNSKQIAKEFNIPISTFHKLENNFVDNPGAENAIKVLIGTSNESMIPDFIREYFPEIEDIYENISRIRKLEEDKYFNTDVESIFNNPIKIKFLALCLSQAGITIEKIKKEFGKEAFYFTKELLGKNILFEDEKGVIRFGDKYKNITSSKFVLQKILNYAIRDCFNPSKKSNYLSLNCEFVNREKVIDQITKVMMIANLEIEKILENPKNAGDEAIWTGFVCDDWFGNSEYDLYSS